MGRFSSTQTRKTLLLIDLSPKTYIEGVKAISSFSSILSLEGVTYFKSLIVKMELMESEDYIPPICQALAIMLSWVGGIFIMVSPILLSFARSD